MRASRIYRKYPQAVQAHAIKRALEGDKITSELSKELDIPFHLINRWKRKYLAEQAVKEEAKGQEEKTEREQARDNEMTLRDRFAMGAMRILLMADLRRPQGSCFDPIASDIAFDAYTCADAMMEARKGQAPLP